MIFTPKTFENLKDICYKIRSHGKTIVWTNGCFDILHVGHLYSLDKAKSLGDYLVVGVNDDASVRNLKGQGRPINKDQHRAKLVDGLKAVDFVYIFPEPSPVQTIEALHPDICCKGSEYRTRPVPEKDLVEGYGGRMEFIELVDDISSTKIIERINHAV